VVDPSTGAAQAVTGLTAIEKEANCGVLDPASGALWTGSALSVGPASVRRITLAGLAAASVVEHLTVSDTIQAVELDGNGDLFVAQPDRVLRVDRNSGAVTTWHTLPPGDEIFNALTIDPDTDRMWTATFNDFGAAPARLFEYDLLAGPAAPTTLADLSAIAPTATGAAFDGGHRLYVSAGTSSTSGLTEHDLSSGVTTAVPALGGTVINGLRYHRHEDRLHMVGGPSNDDYFVYTPSTGQLVTLSTDVIDTPADIAINDWTDRATAYPKRPSAAAAFVLEATAHAAAGELAGVAVTKVNGVALGTPVILGAGFADAGGFVATLTPVPAGLLPQGTALTLQCARVEGGTGLIVLGSEAPVTFQP
jgi:hypothetical protein